MTGLTRRGLLAATPALALAAAAPAADAISLAAWSIQRSYFQAKRWNNLQLPKLVREEFGITALEFVNQFFENPSLRYVTQLKKAASDEGVRLVRIMVDNEGDMAATAAAERRRSVIAHRKWVDIAHELGCTDIRCNARGPADASFVDRAAESFRQLLDYAKPTGLNIIIENHGGASSDGPTLAGLMKKVNDPHFGTLPDFGNINPGDDPYEVIRQLMPFAKGVSVKAMWAADGSHPRYSVEKMIELARSFGFHGDWGIESSFDGRAQGISNEQIWQNEAKGVRLTKSVIEKTVFGKA